MDSDDPTDNWIRSSKYVQQESYIGGLESQSPSHPKKNGLRSFQIGNFCRNPAGKWILFRFRFLFICRNCGTDELLNLEGEWIGLRLRDSGTLRGNSQCRIM